MRYQLFFVPDVRQQLRFVIVEHRRCEIYVQMQQGPLVGQKQTVQPPVQFP
jgi:hypothetical protein